MTILNTRKYKPVLRNFQAELSSAMDIWWGICVLFMSLAILEYAYLLRARLSIGTVPAKCTVKRIGTIDANNAKKRGIILRSEQDYKNWCRRMDGKTMVALLVGFLGTVALYGVVSLCSADSNKF